MLWNKDKREAEALRNLCEVQQDRLRQADGAIRIRDKHAAELQKRVDRDWAALQDLGEAFNTLQNERDELALINTELLEIIESNADGVKRLEDRLASRLDEAAPDQTYLIEQCNELARLKFSLRDACDKADELAPANRAGRIGTGKIRSILEG